MKRLLRSLKPKPVAFPNRITEPGSGAGTMGLQPGSPHIPTQPLAPSAPPEFAMEPLSLQSTTQVEQPQPQQDGDWQRYFNEIYSTLQRRQIPVPQLPMPLEPTQTDWQRLLPVAIGLLFAPEHVRSGALLAAAQRFAGEQEALKQYQQALQERDFQQAELERQAALQQEQADAQARETALRVATGLATDEERRQLQQMLAALQAQSRLDIAKMNADMQAVSRHMAIANNPSLPAEQRAAAYQNAASILAQYGYELPTIPAAPSVPEQQQQLREQIEPQQLQLQREKFDFSKWRASQEVQQGWARINQMQQRLQIQAQSLTRAMQNQNWKQAQDALQNIRSYYGQLGKEENNLIKALNASTRDELGRPVPVYNIPLERQSQLLAGSPPASPLEAQWQDLALRLAAVRRERQRAAHIIQQVVMPAAQTPPPTQTKPVFKTRSGNTFTP